MSTAAPPVADWAADNHGLLVAELERVRRVLAGGAPGAGAGEPEADPPPALASLCAAFGLSEFERDVLLMTAGVELDSSFDRAPTFGLALAALPGAHWSALAPVAPLRHWGLVHLEPGHGLTTARLSIDERVLHYLAGVGYMDDALQGVVAAVTAPPELAPSQLEVAARVAEIWRAPDPDVRRALVQLDDGADRRSVRSVAAAAAAMNGAELYSMRASVVPVAPAEREALARLWEREAVLSGAVLLVEADGDERSAVEAAAALADAFAAPVAVAGMEPGGIRPVVRLPVPRPSTRERVLLWRAVLAGTEPPAAELEAVAATFPLAPDAMRAAGAEWRTGGDRTLWEVCRAHSRPRMAALAQRIEPGAGWEDIVLAPHARALLGQIAAQVRARGRVYEEWGFGGPATRGLGIAALFAGPSGTGKTMAAEVLAVELGLDLYRIDLSSVVSKYIGETEKNLRRVFDAAEEGTAILLFDEADALFGRRSEVKDSHDRYANIEVSYLLQRMEAYRGLAILTTNQRQALDPAFQRRLRFVIEFGFPGPAERAQIWRGAFPADAPTDGIDPDRLAQLEVSGASIRNIAVGGAFLAADAGEPVGMAHLLAAARAEGAKLEQPVSPGEVGGWT